MKKSILAKLLAKENITVQHGNYHTAWFDIKDRVLGLPLWKDMGNDVYDLLIGHEVGHALETPFEGWHDSPEKLEGCPRSYINVIEDARIERKIKRRYVGLIGPMARGYKKLFDENFFGDLSDIDWNEVKLIDKINLQAKVGNHIDVPFTTEEQVYMDRAMTTVTFDDVVALVKDIYEWTKENQEELLNKPEPQQTQEENQNDESELPTGHDDNPAGEDSDDEQLSSGESSSDDDGAEEAEFDNANGNSNLESNADSNESTGTGSDVKPEDTEKSLTDEEFRKNESSLLEVNEKGKQPLFIREYSDKILNDMVWSYSELSKIRSNVFDKLQKDEYFSVYQEEWDKANFEYASYIKNVKKNVNFAVKEFEMRKAAYRYSRSATSKTGSIDINKVWSYKTNDDIFSRVTKLADAKNHGMMMVIDYSGSMSGVLGNVLDQVIHLSMFCKAVNIPFEVYAFTSSNPKFDRYDDSYDTQNQTDGEAYHGGLSMPQLTSSSLKKADFEESIKSLYRRKCFQYYLERSLIAPCEEYGSTPLNAALIASHKLIKKFVSKHNVQNMNFVVISDGDTDGLRVVSKAGVDHTDIDHWNSTDTVMEIGGKKFKCFGTRTRMTEDLLNNIKTTFNATTLGFFIACDRHQYNRKLEDVFHSSNKAGSYWSDEGEDFKKSTQRTFAKNKCAIFNKVLGYDDFYVLKSQNLNTEADEFDVDVDASKGQIANAFKKHSRSKKVNKVLLTQFGKSVAL